jgi:hypothetical protein
MVVDEPGRSDEVVEGIDGTRSGGTNAKIRPSGGDK